MKTTLLLTALLASPAAPSAAEGFRTMARELGAPAKHARIQRVAVLPFIAVDGGKSADGWGLSERLLTQLVRSGKVQAVERSLLKDIMEEHQFARTGAVDAALLKRLGKLFAADGVITGSYVNMGRETSINARLVDVETGVIVAASEHSVERRWSGSPVLEAPPTEAGVLSRAQKPLTDRACLHAATRVDQLEGQILDLKARYWALKLRKGLAGRTAAFEPGSTISDPHLKREFYDKMKAWYASERVPELTPSEIQRFIAVDQEAHALHQGCGL